MRMQDTDEDDPCTVLPRDPTGSYLHLKLKRFPSIKALTMPHAKKTRRQMPHDATVELSPNARSSCRQCHAKIPKGDIRLCLFLQCHKGCKNKAFFHAGTCAWGYPETQKLLVISEIVGWRSLPAMEQKQMERAFFAMKGVLPKKRSEEDRTTIATDEKPRKKRTKVAKSESD
jgi:hypothetical protein